MKALPCPFCGSANLVLYGLSDDDGEHVIVECRECGACGPVTDPALTKRRRDSAARRLWDLRVDQIAGGPAAAERRRIRAAQVMAVRGLTSALRFIANPDDRETAANDIAEINAATKAPKRKATKGGTTP